MFSNGKRIESWREQGRMGGKKGPTKGIKLCHVYVQSPHDKYNHYVLKTCINKKYSNFKKRKIQKEMTCIVLWAVGS